MRYKGMYKEMGPFGQTLSNIFYLIGIKYSIFPSKILCLYTQELMSKMYTFHTQKFKKNPSVTLLLVLEKSHVNQIRNMQCNDLLNIWRHVYSLTLLK